MSETKAGAISIDLLLNSKSFTNQLNNTVNNALNKTAASTTNSVNAMFSKIGKVAAGAFSVKVFGQFTKSCLDLGSDLAEVQNVVDVTFGGMSGSIDEFAKNAISTYGLSETVAKKYAGTFGAMAKSFGYTTAEAVDMSEELTGLTGDVTSFYNLSSDEAYTKLKSVFTGETESIKELGVVMTQNALDQYALQTGLGKTTSAMTEQEKVSLRLAFVQDKLSAATGDFVRTQDGWANQIRVLTLQFDSLKATIGQGLINVFTPVIKVMNLVISKLMTVANCFKAFTDLFGGSKNNVSSGVSQVSDLSSGMSDLSDSTEGVGSSAKKAAKEIQKSVMGFDKLNQLSKPTTDSSGSSGSGGMSGASASDMIPEINTATVADNFVSKFMIDLKDAIQKGEWDTVGILIGEKISESLEKINWSKIKKSINNIVTNIAVLLNGLVIGLNWKILGTTLGEGINSALSIMDTFIHKFNFVNLGSSVGNGLNSAFTTIDWQMIGRTLTNGLYSALTFLHGFVQTFDFKSFGDDIGTVIMAAIRNIDWVQAAGDMSALIIGILKAITAAAKQVDWSYVGETIIEMLKAIDWATLLMSLGDCIINLLPILVPLLLVSATKIIGSLVLQALTASLLEVIGTFFTASLIPFIADKISLLGISAYCGFTDAFAFISQTLLPGIMSAFSSAFAFIAANPIVLLIAAIVALVALIAIKGDEIQGLLQKVDDFMQNIFAKDFTEIFGPVLGGVINGFMSMFKGLFDSVMMFLSGIIDFIRGVFTGDWERAFNGLKEIVGGVFGAMVALVKAPINAIISLVNGLISGLNSLNINVPDWVPDIGGNKIGFNIPKIPMLAQGGYVNANTPQLAMIGDNRHEGEIVTPESKITEAVNGAMAPVVSAISQLVSVMANGNNGDNGDIVIPIYLDGNVLDSVIVGANDRHSLRTGGH